MQEKVCNMRINSYYQIKVVILVESSHFISYAKNKEMKMFGKSFTDGAK